MARVSKLVPVVTIPILGNSLAFKNVFLFKTFLKGTDQPQPEFLSLLRISEFFFVLYSRLLADFLSHLGKWVKLIKFEAENKFFCTWKVFTQKYRSWHRFYSEFLRKKMAVEVSELASRQGISPQYHKRSFNQTSKNKPADQSLRPAQNFWVFSVYIADFWHTFWVIWGNG